MRRRLSALWQSLTAPFRWLKRFLVILLSPITRVYTRVDRFLNDETESIARPLGEILTDSQETPREMGKEILKHIFDLRKHLLRGMVSLALTTSLAFIFAEQILAFLAEPIGGTQNLSAVEVTENIGVFMRVSLLAGFTVALPYLLFEIILYIAPALSPKNRKIALASIPAVVALFVAGMAFTYYVLLKPALAFLVTFMDIPTQVRPASYYPFTTGLMFWIGISFQFPIVILLLSLFGLMKANILLKHARVAVVLLALFAAMITPTVDPVNMLLVWGPLVGLYFIGAWFALVGEKWRQREAGRKAREASTQALRGTSKKSQEELSSPAITTGKSPGKRS